MDLSSINLPPELVIHILEEACRLSPSFCLALSSVSLWTRKLALPHLYTTLIITKFHTAYTMSATLQQAVLFLADHPFIPGPYVRRLWIEPISAKTVDIFTICDNVSELALQESNFYWLIYMSFAGHPSSSLISPVIRRKPDQKLFIINAKNPDWHLKKFVTPSGPASPLYDKITHIWIGKMGAYGPTQLDLAHYRRLTHIAVPYHNPTIQNLGLLLHLLDYQSILCLVVVLLTDFLKDEDYDNAVRWITEARRNNSRLQALPLHYETIRHDWEEGNVIGRSVWEKAEIFTNNLPDRRYNSL